METLQKIFTVIWFALACSCSPRKETSSGASLGDQLDQGKTLYEQTCAQCHYDGSGSSTAPDLRGSAVLAEEPKVLARMILKGRQGESMKDGKKFNGVMPPQAYLSNDEIAAIVVYVRDTFGSRREKFSPQAVAEIRAGIKE